MAEAEAETRLNIHLEQLKLTIRDAWRTLAMLPDPDARFRRAFGGGWVLPVVQDARDAYGACDANVRFTPSPKEISTMEDVFGWLMWLRQQGPRKKYDYEVVGEYAIKRIAVWGGGASIWKIAQREHCSERTIHRRLDRSITMIGVQFRDQIAKIIPMFNVDEVRLGAINEPELRRGRIRGYGEKATADLPGNLEPGRVYVEGQMMFRGEKYRSALDVDEKSCGKRRR